jgi:hypothetical protein
MVRQSAPASSRFRRPQAESRRALDHAESPVIAWIPSET